MKILVVGSGGREHALCWKIAQSPLVEEVYCAPGNGGIAADAVCVNIAADDIESLADFARQSDIDLTVVGPEAPLAAGIVDVFEAAGLPVFGPSRAAAQLEGSKAFAKEAMAEFGIPTAAFGVFTDPEEAVRYIDEADFDVVVKADGLAAGKGVIVARDKDEARAAVRDIMVDQTFGNAGASVVVEQCLRGEEASFIAICDGENILPLASSQDHKAAYEGDTGPNTGGMGAYSPAPVLDDAACAHALELVLRPLVQGMKNRGMVFRGIIYAGLMMTEQGPYVLEFNVRLGDPETQPLLMRLKSDIVPVLLKVARHERIADEVFEWEDGPAVCVVLASGGYPGAYEKGKAIEGLDRADALSGVKVFHAGTKAEDGEIVTAGGRVLGVTAVGTDLPRAMEMAYRAVDNINFADMHYRKDIAQKALKRVS